MSRAANPNTPGNWWPGARHNLGEVPVVLGEEADGFGMGAANHWFEDVVRVSDAILNAESEAQMNIQETDVRSARGVGKLCQARRRCGR